jgi:hypothetical protein
LENRLPNLEKYTHLLAHLEGVFLTGEKADLSKIGREIQSSLPIPDQEEEVNILLHQQIVWKRIPHLCFWKEKLS